MKKTVRLGSFVVLIALSVSLAPTMLPAQTCSREDAIRAEREASTLKQWLEVFDSYKRYSQCDDGAVSEGYSHSVAALLADHWGQFDKLSELAQRYPKFKQFVLGHVDETMTRQEGDTIRKNLRTRCPKESEALCRVIDQRLTESGLN